MQCTQQSSTNSCWISQFVQCPLVVLSTLLDIGCIWRSPRSMDRAPHALVRAVPSVTGLVKRKPTQFTEGSFLVNSCFWCSPRPTYCTPTLSYDQCHRSNGQIRTEAVTQLHVFGFCSVKQFINTRPAGLAPIEGERALGFLVAKEFLLNRVYCEASCPIMTLREGFRTILFFSMEPLNVDVVAKSSGRQVKMTKSDYFFRSCRSRGNLLFKAFLCQSFGYQVMTRVRTSCERFLWRNRSAGANKARLAGSHVCSPALDWAQIVDDFNLVVKSLIVASRIARQRAVAFPMFVTCLWTCFRPVGTLHALADISARPMKRIHLTYTGARRPS